MVLSQGSGVIWFMSLKDHFAAWITDFRKGLEWKVRAQLGGVAVGQVQDENGLDFGWF